jgi:hypothetical protein
MDPYPSLGEARAKGRNGGGTLLREFDWTIGFVIGDDGASKGPIMVAKKPGKSQRQRPATVRPEMIVFVSWSKDSQKSSRDIL